MSHSLFLIGSKARGDHHALSDTDYVCIYDDKKPLLELPVEASVSYYSVPKLKWMIDNSKLFVKHIKDDGRAIILSGKHEALISSFRINQKILMNDLTKFIARAENIRWVPKSNLGLRWGCDYLYFLARNIVFISNAIRGEFTFSYRDGVEVYLRSIGRESLLESFMSLRSEKYLYRLKSASLCAVDVRFLDLINSALCANPVDISFGGLSELGYEQIDYFQLRLIERAIINLELEDNGFLSMLSSHGDYFFGLRRIAKEHMVKFKVNLAAA